MSSRWMRRRWRSCRERGSTPIETVLSMALLLVPIGLLVVTLPTWVEYQHGTRMAAREAARAAVLADTASDAQHVAQETAAHVATNHGIAAGDMANVSVEVPADENGRLARGGAVHVQVAVTVPLRMIPFLGEIGGFTWTSGHTERIDDYRSLPLTGA